MFFLFNTIYLSLFVLLLLLSVQFYCEILLDLLVVTLVSINMTLSTNTVTAIRQVLNEEMKPKWMEVNTLNTVKKGVRHLKKVIQKDFLETCMRKNIYPSEITSIAKKIVGEHQGKKKDQMIFNERQRIMKIRIKLKKEEILRQKLG